MVLLYILIVILLCGIVTNTIHLISAHKKELCELEELFNDSSNI